MDYYQGVVVDYLRADRAVFVNTECCIQLNEGPNPDTTGPHWYCDAVAIDLRDKTIFLCEVSFASKLDSLLKRLKEWSEHWTEVHNALCRDCLADATWKLRPWLFVPNNSVSVLVPKLRAMTNVGGGLIFEPRITPLECVQPWNYHSWNHQDKDTEKLDVPETMRL